MAFQKGQSGNPTGLRKDRLFRDAILMELKATGTEMKDLRRIARALIDKAADKDIPAIKEFADRIDGKVPQAQIHMGDEEGGPVTITRIELVAPNVNSEN